MNKPKYDPKMARQMVKYFRTWKVTEDVDGKPTFNGLPTFAKFAARIKVSPRTLYRWATPGSESHHPEFEEAYFECKCILADLLADKALAGEFEPKFTKYLRETVCGRSVDGPVDFEEAKSTAMQCRISLVTHVPGRGKEEDPSDEDRNG